MGFLRRRSAIVLLVVLGGCSEGKLRSNVPPGDDKDAGDDAPSGPGIDFAPVTCGDSNVNGGEACDDGNTMNGDGCAADCKTVEPGYSCPSAQGFGGACMKI